MVHRKSNTSQGFTLVELIIVIAIVAVLSAVLAPQYIKYVAKSKETVCQKTIRELEHAFWIETVEQTDNPVSALNDVMTGAGLTKDGDALSLKYSGGCPEGGVYTVKLEGSRLSEFTCSKHGEQILQELTDPDKGIEFLKTAFESYLDQHQEDLFKKASRLDSNGHGVVDDFRPQLEAMLKSEGYRFTDSTIWRVSWQKDSEGNRQLKLYWADPGVKLTPDNYDKYSGVSGKQVDFNGDEPTVKDATIYFGISTKDNYVVINNNLNFTGT